MKKFFSALCILLLIICCIFSFSACGSKVENFNLSFKVDDENYATISTNGSETITIPENPVKEGYNFDGWYWDKDVWSKPFTANSLMDAPISSDMSVYAKFSAIEYDITYENDDGTHSNPVSYTIEDSFALSAAEKIGYTFVGWYSDAAYTTKVESVSAGSKGAITLYAKFEINNYTISYGNTMDVVNSNVTSYNVNTDTITLSDLSKTGYVFEGWYNGEEKVTEIAKGSIGDITLTAKWSVIGYEITYHNVDGATNSNPATYDVEDQPLALSDASKDGYRFLGWYTDAAFSNKVSEIAIGITGDINLYAKWELIEYTATFKDGDTVVETIKFTVESESITEPAVPNHVGYTGEWESYTLGTEDITIKAVYSLVNYGITYNNVSGATNSNPTTYNVEDQPLALVDASKAHYTFLGWYSDTEFNNEVTEISVGTTGTVELYAKWEAIEYTATFMDGDTEVGKIKFTVESESITEPAVPNHVGYTGAWENYTLGAENITVNAVYTLISYGIQYNNVSGATNGNPTTYDVEDQPLTLVDASKAHYIFLGWYSDASFTTKVTEIAVGTTGTVDLYAKWEAVEYTITFLYDNAIGDYAEGTVVKTIYTVEDEFAFAALVCKTVGHTFDGWYTEKNVGDGVKMPGITKGTAGDITVYAQFGLEEYDIIYNNVNGAMNNNPTHYNATSENFTIYPLTKEGYTFDGWFTDEECTTPANLTITKGSNGDITLYAKWTPITYTIEYVTYGGTATGNPMTYIVTDSITFNNATLSGSVFKGWHTAAEGGSKVTGITAGTTGNIILYAHWDYVSTITFNSNGGSVVAPISNVEGTAISAPVAPTKEHYTFAGWYNDSALTKVYSFTTQPAEDITLYAKWTPVVYEIEYVLNGGTNSKNNVFEYTVEDKIEFYAPSKVGYDFIGWFTDAEFTSSVVTELKMGTSGKITLYAHYSINQYTISFESNGGTSVSAITQNYATSVTAPEAPSKNGYTFSGWYSNASLTSKYIFSTMPAENITLYAKWDLANYNIAYNLNGGTNNSGNPATYTITSATITLKAPTKTSYSFAGWYTDAECTEAIIEITSGSYGVVELFAKWTATKYTITYVTADGATHSNILTYTIETDLTILADAALKGYAFGGWYTDGSYGTAVTTVAGGEIGNKTVYAKFTANTYNVWLDGNEEASCVVSFNLNGAEGTIASQTVTPTATLKYPTVPTRDGCIFAGWYDNENCTGSLYDFTTVVTNNTTLYAKWVKVENATAIAINGSSNVTLNGKYEQMLMFVPLVSGNITITASGSYDTFGVLYNSEMVALAQDDDNASDGVNFLIVYNITAGETYYIGARAFSSTTTGTATVNIAGSTTVLDGGYAITASKGTATYGQNFTLNVPNDRDGYKFLGYADENGVIYTDATGASVKVWDKDSDTTLYSQWERAVYTVTFVTSGGTAIESVELAYGERLDIGKFVTTRSGYSFNGWYLDGTEYNATTMPDHDITLTAYWKTFALGTIKYDIDKTAVSVDDEITAVLFSAMCLDTDGNLATFTVTVSGTQAVGETISVRLVATSGNKTKQLTISDVKVYGDPTLTYDDTVDYFNIKDGLIASWFNAYGTDSFGNATTIQVYVEHDYEAGDYVTVTIESTDPAGNSTYGYIENVGAYGLPEITYNENKTAISVNDILNAELFGATAKDSFGEALTVTVSRYSGTISAGNAVTIRISATDSKGNVTNIDVQCKVYGAPTISSASKTDVRISDNITTELLGITAQDTYGEALDITLNVEEDTQKAGTTMTVTATVNDISGNVITKDYTLKVYGTPTISYDRDGVKATEDVANPSCTVKFDLNGANGNVASQVVTSTVGLVYPEIPMRSGYVFKGWYTSSDCTMLFDFSAAVTQNTTVYAGWHQITTSGYSNSVINVVDENNSSSDYYSVSTQATSSSNANYTYFTILKDGTYNLYYKNGSSSTNYRTYMYIYNATQGTVIKSNTYISSTSYSYVSFTAKAGDVIYVRNYRYSTSSDSFYTTFYMYVTGGGTPAAGGIVSSELAAQAILSATATDSFGNQLNVKVIVKSGSLTAGTNIVYTLTAVDHLGNVSCIDTAPIGVYDVNDINLTYSAGMSDIIKLSSSGEEFGAKATDSFGNDCVITVEAAEGYTLAGGNTISLYIVATDTAGNRLSSDLIENIKVYAPPVVIVNQKDLQIDEETDVAFLFSVYDSFGEELYYNYIVEGEQSAGNYINVTVNAIDDANNSINCTYTFAVYSETIAYVQLFIEDTLWAELFVNDLDNYTLPIPTDWIFFTCWKDSSGTAMTNEKGEGISSLSSNNKLYAYRNINPIYTKDDLLVIEANKNYQLMNDLDLAGIEWVPIELYEGTFDGNNFTISNFQITVSSRETNSIGFFATNKGTIKNLNLSDFNIRVTYPSTAYGQNFTTYIGGLVANNTGILNNCSVETSIVVDCQTRGVSIYSGAIAAYSTGNITDCRSSGSVSVGFVCTAADTEYGTYYIRVGGAIGYAKGTINNTSSSCYVRTTASGGSSRVLDTRIYTGGLIGYNASKLIGCYSTGSVSSTISATHSYYNTEDVISYAGGLIGGNYGNIEQCYSKSSVSASLTTAPESSRCVAGGLIGVNGSYTVKNCYSTGSVTVTSTASASSSNAMGNIWAYGTAGGLIGSNSGTVSYCYSTSSVSVTCSSTNGYMAANAYSYIGGLIGSNSGSLTACVSSGNITTRLTTNSTDPTQGGVSDHEEAYVGGLVGSHSSGYYTSCYYSSKIKYSITINGVVSSSATTSKGSSTSSYSNISFYSTTLGWDGEIWDFSASNYPTLR